MFPRTFGQQIKMTAPCRQQPVNGFVEICKTQHFHRIGKPVRLCPVHNPRQRVLFFPADFGARNLTTGNAGFRQQMFDNNQFFFRFERHAAGLLAVTNGRIYNINHIHRVCFFSSINFKTASQAFSLGVCSPSPKISRTF